MKKIALALLLFLVPASWSLAAEQSPAAKAVAGIKLKPNWDRIEFVKDSPNPSFPNHVLKLMYKPKAKVTLAAVESDTKLIARAVLAEMARQGPVGHPLLMMFGQQAVRGETGKELVTMFGHAQYNSEKDKVEFVRDTGK